MIPLDLSRSTLPGMVESADREKSGMRWKEFNSRRLERSLMRSVANDCDAALRELEEHWAAVQHRPAYTMFFVPGTCSRGSARWRGCRL